MAQRHADFPVGVFILFVTLMLPIIFSQPDEKVPFRTKSVKSVVNFFESLNHNQVPKVRKNLDDEIRDVTNQLPDTNEPDNANQEEEQELPLEEKVKRIGLTFEKMQKEIENEREKNIVLSKQLREMSIDRRTCDVMIQLHKETSQKTQEELSLLQREFAELTKELKDSNKNELSSCQNQLTKTEQELSQCTSDKVSLAEEFEQKMTNNEVDILTKLKSEFQNLRSKIDRTDEDEDWEARRYRASGWT